MPYLLPYKTHINSISSINDMQHDSHNHPPHSDQQAMIDSPPSTFFEAEPLELQQSPILQPSERPSYERLPPSIFRFRPLQFSSPAAEVSSEDSSAHSMSPLLPSPSLQDLSPPLSFISSSPCSPPPFSPLSPIELSISPSSPVSMELSPSERHLLSPGRNLDCEPVYSNECLSSSDQQQSWLGFKIVGDNIDKSVRPRHETIHVHPQTLHYFHAYAVLDRIDFSHLSDEPSQIDPSMYSPEILMPCSTDLKEIIGNFAILIARTLSKYMPEFAVFQDAVVDHIPHKYSAEMSRKSHVVCSIYVFVNIIYQDN